jgi:hypothetical protein
MTETLHSNMFLPERNHEKLPKDETSQQNY